MRYDKETEKHIRENEAMIQFVQGREWNMVKDRLLEKLMVLDSIEALPDDIDLNEIKMRRGAISIVREWIIDIEGELLKARNENETMNKGGDSDHIKRFE